MKASAEAIYAWRMSHKLTRERLAHLLGKSLSTVVRWEHEEKSDPRISEILAMEALKPGLFKRLLPRKSRRSGPSRS